MSNVLEQLNAGLATAVEAASGSLVQITSGPRGRGAGIIWRPDGLILTNAHVVGRPMLDVTLPDGRLLPARVIARHADHDLAAVRVDAAGLLPARPGDSRAIRAGEWVLALGHPWGVPGAATTGVIIGVGDRIPENPMPGREWIAVNLHYRPGHSGGPLVDAQGRVIGINTVMAGPDVGLAVPVHVALRFVNALLELEHRAAAA